MYELYDPCTLMLFHRSKPLVVDAGYGPVRKLTEISSAAWLRTLLLRTVRTALDLRLAVEPEGSTGSGSSSSGGGRPSYSSADAPDAPASLKEEAARLAQGATAWLEEKSETISTRVGAIADTSGGWLQQAEERGWSVLQRASVNGWSALETARQRILQKTTGGGQSHGGQARSSAGADDENPTSPRVNVPAPSAASPSAGE